MYRVADQFPDTCIFLNAGAMDLKQYHFVALVPLSQYEFGLKEVFCQFAASILILLVSKTDQFSNNSINSRKRAKTWVRSFKMLRK